MKYKVEFVIEGPDDEDTENTIWRIRSWLETDLDYNNVGDDYKDLVLGMSRITIKPVEK